MKLAQFWTRQPGEATGPNGRIRVTARGWSNQSLEDAARVARETAQRVAQRVATGITTGQYLYGERPLPEPVLQSFGDAAVVTRNIYGAEVLNARDLMFVDIDRDGSGVPRDIQKVAERRGLSVRAYKTAAGYRAVITNYGFAATSPDAQQLLRDFGSDPLYIQLCKSQESFRARLTPKPWRCGLRPPTVAFPFETAQQQAQFGEWEAQYNVMAQRFATCQFIGVFGSMQMAPAFEDLIYLHDVQTKATSNLPLA